MNNSSISSGIPCYTFCPFYYEYCGINIGSYFFCINYFPLLYSTIVLSSALITTYVAAIKVYVYSACFAVYLLVPTFLSIGNVLIL